jgi:hypothetical protein
MFHEIFDRHINNVHQIGTDIDQIKAMDVQHIIFGHVVSPIGSGNTISFQSFTPDDYNKIVLDVKAAKQFLIINKNANSNNISIVGASMVPT